MQINKIYCDHCGKELDPMRDYVQVEIDIITTTNYLVADLCEGCMVELENLMYKFVNKEIPKD